MRERWKWGPAKILAILMFLSLALSGCRRHTPAKSSSTNVPGQSGQRQSVPDNPPSPQAEATVQPACSETEIHYSPDEDLEQIDSQLLSSAESEIEFTAFSFTDKEIASVLEERASQGVRIKIYSDHFSTAHELARANGAEAVILQLARTPNIQVRVKRSSTLAHMKAFEIDGKILRTGSANFSANAERKQDNDLLIIRDAATVDSYRMKFEEMWDRPDNDLIE